MADWLKGELLLREWVKSVSYTHLVVKIEFRRFYKTFEQIVRVRMKIKDQAERFQNAEPVFGLLLVDVGLLCDIGDL